MAKVLPLPFKLVFVYIEPLLSVMGAFSAYSQPEWLISNLFPGPTVSGLLHTQETNLMARMWAVLLLLLALISLAIFPVIQNKSDTLSFSIARRLLFVLGGITYTRDC
jgi:hypothetical protein